MKEGNEARRIFDILDFFYWKKSEKYNSHTHKKLFAQITFKNLWMIKRDKIEKLKKKTHIIHGENE